MRKLFQNVCIIICILCSLICVVEVCLTLNLKAIVAHTITNENLEQFSESEYKDLILELDQIKLVLDKKDYFSHIFPWILSVISAIIAYFASYFITRRNNEKDFQAKCSVEYLKYLNLFLGDINSLYTKMTGIAKLTRLFVYQGYIPRSYSFNNNDDFLNFIHSMEILERYIQTIPQDNNTINWKQYILELTDFNLFIDIGNKFEVSVGHYFYIIDKKIFEGHKKLMNELRSYTSNNMKGFYPMEYKKKILAHIKFVNEIVMGKKYEFLDFDK